MHFHHRLAAVSLCGAVLVAALGGVAGAQPARASRSVAAASPAAAQTVVNPALSVTSDSYGNEFVFWKGRDGNLWDDIYNASTSTWSSATAVPGMGPIGSQPSVTLLVPPLPPVSPELHSHLHPAIPAITTYLEVVWEGVDDNLWTVQGSIANEASTPATISWPAAPSAVPGMGPLGSQPAATFAVDGFITGPLAERPEALFPAKLWVFWKGQDGSLWSVAATIGVAGALTWPGSPTAIPGMGPLGSAPAAGSDLIGDIYVFWQGSTTNTHVWEAWYDNAAASPAWSSAPIDLGQYSGNTGSSPSVAVTPTGQQYIFWQGQDANLWFAEWTGGIVGGPVSHAGRAGRIVDPPPPGWLNNTFNYIGKGPLNSAPAASVTSTGNLSVFWQGTDFNVWTTSSPTSSLSWSGPSSIGGGPLAGV
jgi:hypothetical protein